MNSEIRVKTNRKPREIIDAWQLTTKEREEFDYLDWEAIEQGNDSASFFRYRGELYDLGDFVELPPPSTPNRPYWHKFQSDSYFSGILIRWVNPEDNEEGIVVGLLLA